MKNVKTIEGKVRSFVEKRSNTTPGQTGWMIVAMVLGLFANQVSAQQSGPPTTGLQVWLEANAGVTTNGSGQVTNWASQVGSVYAAPSSESGNSAPTLVNDAVGGNPAISFNGSTGLQLSGLSAVTAPYTVFVVLANYTNVSEAIGADSANLRFGNSGSAGNVNLWPGNPAIAYPAANSTGASVIAAVVQPGSGGNNTLQVFQQGLQILAPTANTAGTSTPFEGDSTLGDNTVLTANGYTTYTGYIAEVLVYNTALSSTNMQAVQSYFSVKYSLNEAFYGPFPSWVNITSPPYNAKGDGVTDCTTNIQSALNALETVGGPNGTPPTNSVLYFPAGTYKISSGLELQKARDIAIMGQDPLTTTIKWGGATNSTVPMLWLNGVQDSCFGRITWDGAGSTVTGMAHYYYYTNSPPTYYDSTGLYHSDEVFQNMAVGLALGKTAVNYSVADGDVDIVRDHFYNCSGAGVRTGSYNSFQNYIWDSEFVNCYDGADNAGGEGSFYVYRSYFQNSSHADIWLYLPFRSFDFRGNTSVSSAQFVLETDNSQTIDGLQFQDNKILDPKNGVAISSTETGDIVLTDNQIRMLSGSGGPADVVMNTSTFPYGPDLDSISNTYTLFTPPFVVEGTTGPQGAPRSYTQNDSVVSIGSINSTVPTMPGTPANLGRPSMDVSPTNSAAQINALFASPSGWAYTNEGRRPVVHFPVGTYSINQTIVIPSGLDVQLVGDSMASVLNWTSTNSGVIMQLTGPSSALVSGLFFNGEGIAKAIYVSNPDQVGSKIYVEGGDWEAFSNYGILVNGCTNAIVEAHAFECGSIPSSSLGARVIDVLGSGSASATGYTAVFGSDGGTDCNTNSAAVFQVSNRAQLDVVDHYYESVTPRLIQLSGINNVTFAGEVGCPVGATTNPPWVELDNASGNAAFIDCYTIGDTNNFPNPYIYINGENSNTKALFMGFTANTYNGVTNYFSRTASGGTVSLVNSKYGNTNGACYQTGNQGNALTTSFVTNVLSQSRAIQPMFPPTITSGITSVQLLNVGMSGAVTCLQVGP